MLFFKKNKVKESETLSFIKEADVRLMEAFNCNEDRYVKGIVTYDFLNKMRSEINARRGNYDQKYGIIKLMDREYTVVEEDDEKAVIKRDIYYHAIKTSSLKFKTGVDFSELITINKVGGYKIAGLCAA